MARINLSTRPFYNERLATFLIAIAGVVAIGVLAFSVQQIVSLSSQRTELRGRIAQDHVATERSNAEAATIHKSINQKVLRSLALNATQANRLIDERTFSWTVFFSLIGKTLPDDVRIDSVQPSIDKEDVIVLMTIVSKRTDDLAMFIERLQATGAFYDILPQQADTSDDGSRRTTVIARYLPPKAEASPTAAPGKSDASPKPASAQTAPAKAGGVK